jgi:hypothetical protein
VPSTVDGPRASQLRDRKEPCVRELSILGRQYPAAYIGHCNQMYRAKSIGCVEFFGTAANGRKNANIGKNRPFKRIELLLS